LSLLLCCTTAATASSAHAWTTNGPLNYTSNAPAALFSINTSPAIALDCGGPNFANGVVNASATATPFNAATVNFAFNGCTAAGFAMLMSCQTAQLWLTSYTAPVSTGEIRNFRCTLAIPSLTGCVVTYTGAGPSGRAFAVTYDNTTGRLTLLNPNPPHLQQQYVTASWPSACSFLFGPAGSAATRITSLSYAQLAYQVTSTPKPSFTNP
jgi:hypothetical protein